MPAKTADIIRRVQFGATDKQARRFTLQDIADAMNEGARLLAETTRATTVYQTLTLAEGTNQDLRDAGPSDAYVALRRIEHNIGGGTVRLTDHEALDRTARTWRTTALASQIDEYAVDARQPQRFTVFPPAQAGVQVRALVAPYPPRFCVLNVGGTALQNANEEVPLEDGFDTALVDYTLFRLFTSDAGDPSYAARAEQHLKLAQLATGAAQRSAG